MASSVRFVAAAALALMLAACQATSGSSGSPATTAGGAASGGVPASGSDPASGAPGSVARGSVAPSPAAAELRRSSGPLPAGRYTRAGFEPRITFAVEPGTWHVGSLADGFFDIQDAPNTPGVVAVQFARPEGIYGSGSAAERATDAGAALDLLRENASVVIVESSESRIGGLVGSQVTLENPASAIRTARVMEVPPGTLGFDPGRRLWIALFDTPSGLLAVIVGGTTARWDDALRLAEPVLESVTIGG